MRFARLVFLVAGLYGLGLLPMYFAEGLIGRWFPPQITHPEFFYGFLGVVIVFHILFLVVSRDPARYRPVMLVAVLEKFVFGLPTIVLFVQGRAPFAIVIAALIDLAFGVLFVAAYRATAESAAGAAATPSRVPA
jgi:hypothetical protein